MPHSEALRLSLRKLALSPASANGLRIWRAFSNEERELAITAALDNVDGQTRRKGFIAAVARALHFRPQFIERWTEAKLTRSAARIELSDESLAWAAITTFHLARRTSLLSQFLDTLRIPHENGRILDDAVLGDPFAQGALAAAADQLLIDNDVDAVVLYLLALRAGQSHPFQHLDPWLVSVASRDRSADAGSLVHELNVAAPSGDLADDLTPANMDVVGLTTLDRRLISTVVDSAAGVTGAGTVDEIDDLLLELQQLNGRRHATFFHLGFRDSLFRRPPAQSLEAENEIRWRWYWAGFVSGLARSSQWKEIVSLFDQQASIRTLGEAADGPGFAATYLVFHALTEAARFSEAGAFAGPAAASASPRLRSAMLTAAVRLIHASRAADARPLLDTLWNVLEKDHDSLDEEEFRFLVAVQRRRALCLRQLDESREALRLLQDLASLSDPFISAIARTDIGLIKAGFRRLGEIALPPQRADLQPFIESLERGEPDLQFAAASKTFTPAHANFALAVLALAREQYAEASHRLDGALTYFSSRPDMYRADGTLALAHLYLGLSLCLSLDDSARLSRARELLLLGLDAGAKIPVYLIRLTIDSLNLARADLAGPMASEILERCGDTALDELATSEAASTSTMVRNALVRRAASPSQSAPCRAADYRRVLPWLLASEEVAEATSALDFLEVSAHSGVGRQEFVDLLKGIHNFSPAWSQDRATEARVRLLEVEGRYDEAAFEIESVAHRVLASEDDASIEDAALLLKHLEGYGSIAEPNVARVRPVVEARVAQRDRCEMALQDELLFAAIGDRTDVRILVVGGNEVQERMDDDIRTRVAAELPGVSVDFVHTGWTSRWSSHADEFQRRLDVVDGVVLLQLMRTTLGWTLRARCHLPWRSCRGRGQGEIFNTIARVVPVARARLAARRDLGAATR